MSRPDQFYLDRCESPVVSYIKELESIAEIARTILNEDALRRRLVADKWQTKGSKWPVEMITLRALRNEIDAIDVKK